MSLMKIKQEVVCIFTLLSRCVLDTKCTFRDELAVHQQTGVAEAERIVLFIFSVVVSLQFGLSATRSHGLFREVRLQRSDVKTSIISRLHCQTSVCDGKQ